MSIGRDNTNQIENKNQASTISSGQGIKDQLLAKYNKTPAEMVKALLMYKPKEEYQYILYTTVLNKDITSSSDPYGVIIHLGSYKTPEAAEEGAKAIIAATGVTTIKMVRTFIATQLNANSNIKQIDIASNDLKPLADKHSSNH